MGTLVPRVVRHLGGLLLACCLVGITPAWGQAPAQPEPAPAAAEHAAPGIAARKAVAPPTTEAPSDAARQAALDAVAARLACACEDSGDLKVDLNQSLTDPACQCAYAQRMRTDLTAALAGLTSAQLADKRTVAETIESTFVPMAAEYERVFRFDKASYDWFMHNVRCVCDGCKPTVFFDKCQLTCSPAIIYKLRVRVFLAMGYSKEEVLEYYLAEYNAEKPPREQVGRDWLLPRKQEERGWLVPAIVIGGAIAALWLSLRRWRKAGSDVATPTPSAGTEPETPVAEATSASDRARLQDALDDLDD